MDYILELPLKEDPSPHFKRFINNLNEGKRLDCMVQYWRGKLTFSSDKMPNNEGKLGSKASTCVASQVSFRKIARFTSKFNAAMSMICISASNKNGIHIELCNQDSDCSICITFTVDDLATQMAIDNFFTVIG